MSATETSWGELSPNEVGLLRALMPPILGLEGGDLAHVETAIGRLDDFLIAIPADKAREIHLLFAGLRTLSMGWFWGREPHALTPDQLDTFLSRLFDRQEQLLEQVVQAGGPLLTGFAATGFDVARSLRELMCVAYWSNPATDALSGYVPVWERASILGADPGLAQASPYTTPDRTRLEVKRIQDKLGAFEAPPDDWFKNDGRPRVAIIGSGPGGSAAASALARDHDLVVFEAGPRFRSDEYPLDTMAAMALLYEGGLMTPSRDIDLRVLRARVVGGGSVVNEGVTIRPRSGTLDHWQSMGAGFDRAALEKALDDVEVRQRFREISADLSTSVPTLWADGMKGLGQDIMVSPVLSDLATHAVQHQGTPHRDLLGDRCVGCGLCNFGCRFGHHMTVDRTFLWDAEQAGARVVANAAVERLVSTFDPALGLTRISGIVLERAPGVSIPVDFVLVAAGTPGSPALLLRSAGPDTSLGRLPAATQELLGSSFGLNVGTPAVARWDERPKIPGYAGVQTRYVATKAGDDSFILENGYVSPGILSGLMPGFGRDHRRLMGHYRNVGFAVNTIGTPSTGRVNARGVIDFDVHASTMDTIRRTLTLLIDGYLHSGAAEVWPGGVHRQDGPKLQFTQADRGNQAGILARLQAGIQLPEDVQIGSGHPQGGLPMNDSPRRGVVDGRFKVHGTSNLYVADASVFPTTITVNLQWLVMGLGLLAGRTLAGAITGRTH